MSFLDLFKKTPKGPTLSVRVWINQVEKEKACIRMAQTDTALIFIAWSKVTFQHYKTVFRKQDLLNDVMMARDLPSSDRKGRSFIFLERHYDHDKEQEFLESYNADQVLALVSLSDPIMSAFNPERIQKLMDKMGHMEGEYIEHKMISKSIERAMEKIKNGGLPVDRTESMKEWIEGME